MSEAAHQRYVAAAHAMQSGVATKMGYYTKDVEPKSLRVGINSAMVEHAALAQLLMSKGIITEEEYLEAIAAGMEREAELYRAELSEHYGTNITLA